VRPGRDMATIRLTDAPDSGYSLENFFQGYQQMTRLSERHFQTGLGMLAAGKYAEAAVRFQAAIASEKQGQVLRPQMRYRSYFGLSRALSRGAKLEDVKLCEMAAQADHFDPVLQLNLGRVYLRAGKTARALRTFRQGLRLDPKNEELLVAFRRADRRGRPVIGTLSRDHGLNRLLGRLRARFLVRA
jgi:tetratricopeptide (TPR) repeat protein